MSHPSARRNAALVALFVTFLWSTSWVLIRKALDDARLPPITFAGLRYGLAAALLVAWSRTGSRRSVHVLDRTSIWPLVALGAVTYGMTQGAQFVAIDSQPAATTNLMLAMTPLAVALTSAAFLGERTTRRQRVGGAVIVAGAFVYFAGDLGATTVGMVAATIGLLANAVAALLGRAVNRSTPLTATSVTAASMTIGAVLLLATGLAIDGIPRPTAQAIAIIGWLAVVNTAFAWTWWSHAQRVLTAAEMAAINTTMAVQIPILAWIFLDEPLGIAEAVGITLVVIGVLSMRRRSLPSAQQLRPARRGIAATRYVSPPSSK